MTKIPGIIVLISFWLILVPLFGYFLGSLVPILDKRNVNSFASYFTIGAAAWVPIAYFFSVHAFEFKAFRFYLLLLFSLSIIYFYRSKNRLKLKGWKLWILNKLRNLLQNLLIFTLLFFLIFKFESGRLFLKTRIGSDFSSYLISSQILKEDSLNSRLAEILNQKLIPSIGSLYGNFETTSNFKDFVTVNFLYGPWKRDFIASILVQNQEISKSDLINTTGIFIVILLFVIQSQVIMIFKSHSLDWRLGVALFLFSPIYLVSAWDGFWGALLVLPFFTLLLLEIRSVWESSNVISVLFQFYLGLIATFIYPDILPIIFLIFTIRLLFLRKKRDFGLFLLIGISHILILYFLRKDMLITLFERKGVSAINGFTQIGWVTPLDVLGLNPFLSTFSEMTVFYLPGRLANFFFWIEFGLLCLIFYKIMNNELARFAFKTHAIVLVSLLITLSINFLLFVSKDGANNYSHFRITSLFSLFLIYFFFHIFAATRIFKSLKTYSSLKLNYWIPNIFLISGILLLFSLSQNLNPVNRVASQLNLPEKLLVVGGDYQNTADLFMRTDAIWLTRNVQVLNAWFSNSKPEIGDVAVIFNRDATLPKDCSKISNLNRLYPDRSFLILRDVNLSEVNNLDGLYAVANSRVNGSLSSARIDIRECL